MFQHVVAYFIFPEYFHCTVTKLLKYIDPQREYNFVAFISLSTYYSPFLIFRCHGKNEKEKAWGCLPDLSQEVGLQEDY